MRIAIVDDVQKERKLLLNRLKKQFSGYNIEGDFEEYESGEAFLAAAREAPFSVVFLDIYMTGADGIKTAKELRTFDAECLLVFTTTSEDHALEGFKVRALHYLVKPYTEGEVEELVEEIISRAPKPEKYMDIKVSGSMVRVHFKEIVYAEHFSHQIHIHTTARKTLVTRQSFREFTGPLQQEERFFICGRGTVVNLEHVSDFDDSSFLLEEGTRLPVSRDLLKTARQVFMEFLLERGRV